MNRRPARRPGLSRGAAGTVEEWLRRASEHLRARGVCEIRANVEFIMAAALKIGRAEIVLHRTRVLSDRQSRHFWNLIEERGKRVPLAYVLGSQNFMGYEIKVGPEVLIPRPETEELVAETIKLLSARTADRLHLLEIGTGSGCIAVALSAAFPQAIVYATDLSPSVMGLALRNAEAHHRSRSIRFIQEDLFKPGERQRAVPGDIGVCFGAGGGERRGWADLLISNPPYVPTAEIDGLEEEVRREPRLALDGGPDGLDALRAIIAGSRGTLRPDGLLALEIGAGQAPAVRALLETAGFKASFRRDRQGHERIAIGAL